ncbi:hypothetical protein THRCLA_00447 [Thraustotheca clavata]|uniref:Uncharacterized protein n=1 Tax=Thraustotheca clavata TaxID=74557 RepID=A0A1W0AB69_9STRA|nr:hypothetical protein THRCLA_00447 [Thraustotheca clavata]
MSNVVVASDGNILSTTYTGCNRFDRLGYDLPTKTCSSGSPIISEITGCVGKLGDMNSGVRARDIVVDLMKLGSLPQSAATTVELEQRAQPKITTELDSHRSTFDSFLISTKEPGALTIDLLAWTVDTKGHWYDLRLDCDASHFDSKIILAFIDPFDGRLHHLIENDNDTRGDGRKDGSIDARDAYLDVYLTLPGNYYILVGTSAMTLDSVVGNTTWSSDINGCGHIKAFQGNYKMTIEYDSTMLSNLELPTASSSNTSCLQPNCPPLSALDDISLQIEAVVAGTLCRASLAMDYIAFEMLSSGRIAIDVVSYQEYENATATKYLDPSRLVAVADNRSLDSIDSRYYRSISTRDPYLEINLPRGNYTLVVGHLRDPTAPLLCGGPHAFGHYHVFFSTSHKGTMGTPQMPVMGAGGSIEQVPGARKLQNFIAMKAFNLRQAEGKTISQQFSEFKFKDDGVDYINFEKLCSYLQLPAARKDAFISIFPVQNNRLRYVDFVQFIDQTKSLTVQCIHRTESPRAPAPPNNEPQPPPSLQLVSLQAPRIEKALNNTPGLWKKREITIQERIVEYTKIDEHGVPQNLIEKEKHQHEIIHMESTTGEFAHREVTYFEQTEELNNEIVHHDTGKEEFVHLKSKDDEISHFESNMPQRPPEACEQPPPSPTIKKEQTVDDEVPNNEVEN